MSSNRRHLWPPPSEVEAAERAKERREAQKQERERLQKAMYEAHIQRLVDEAPPLSDEQRARLAALLHAVR